MNRPSFAAYLLGNPLSVLAATGVTATLGYKAAQGEVMFVPLLLMGLLTLRTWHCASRIAAYRRWQREWNAMSGGAQDMHRGGHIGAPSATRSGAMIGGGNGGSHAMNRRRQSNDNAGGGAPIFARIPWLKPALGLILWGVVIALAQPMLHSADNPLSTTSGDNSLFPTCFWLGNLIVGGVVLVRTITAARRRFGGGDKALDVTICLRTPLHSPDYRQTFAQLPDHCRKLFHSHK